MDDLRHKFGARLRELRRTAGLTQERLAERVGISVDFISLVERGVNAPSFDTLEKIAITLRVQVKELFNFDKEN